jgi:hypothetical protein
VTFSGYHSLVLVDVEPREGRAFVAARGERRALRRILDDACAATGAGRHDVHRSSRDEGFVLAFHAATAKADLTTRFVRALDLGLREHAELAPPGGSFRLRVALHAGDVRFRGTSWTGQALAEAAALADSDVLRRVLAAAPGATSALAVSAAWYSATIEQGRADGAGFARVWMPAAAGGRAWVRVPGIPRPPGLTPADTVRPVRTPRAAGELLPGGA